MKFAKFVTIITLLIFSLIVAGIITAQENDETLNFTFLLPNEAQQSGFEEGIYAHLYTFWGTAGDVVSIQMNRIDDSEVDPYLILLGINGAVLAVDDDGGDVIGNAFIKEFELPDDGLYLVFASFADFIMYPSLVIEQKDFGPMDYEILIKGSSELTDELDIMVEMDAPQLELGDSATLEISKESSMVLATFTAEADDKITIMTSPTEDTLDTMLFLFNPFGEVIAFNDDGEGTAEFYSSIDTFVVIDDGFHLIIATSYQFYNALEDDWENTGSFALSLTP